MSKPFRRPRLSRKGFFVSILSTLALASACGKTAVDDPGPRRLTVAVPRDAANLAPYTAGDAHNDFMLELIYDKLSAPSPYIENPRPWLAESIERIDGRTWRVKVRSGIRWHDGAPFSADDVKFTFEYYRDGPLNRWTHHTSKVPKILDVSIVDTDTLRVTCADPCPAFDRVTAADLPIIPRHVWNNVKAPRTFTDSPVGTGPFVFVEHVADQFYRFKANREYFRGQPAVDELVLRVIKDPSNAFIALKTGDVAAVARVLPPELVPSFQALRGIRVVRTRALSGVEALMNYGKVPFRSKEFRKALNLGVERRVFLEYILMNRGASANLGYPHPASHWTKPDIQVPFDPTRSRTMLDGLGMSDRDGDGFRELPDGGPFEITVTVGSNEPGQIRAAELLASQLARMGLKAKSRPVDAGSLRQFAVSMEFDIQISGITPHSLADPDQFVMSHKSGYLWREGIPYPEMDPLIERWGKAETLEERRRAGFAMQEFFNEFPTSLILYYPDEYWAFRPSAYDGWAEAPGQGIVHKWSFLAPAVRAGVVTNELGR